MVTTGTPDRSASRGKQLRVQVIGRGALGTGDLQSLCLIASVCAQPSSLPLSCLTSIPGGLERAESLEEIEFGPTHALHRRDLGPVREPMPRGPLTRKRSPELPANPRDGGELLDAQPVQVEPLSQGARPRRGRRRVATPRRTGHHISCPCVDAPQVSRGAWQGRPGRGPTACPGHTENERAKGEDGKPYRPSGAPQGRTGLKCHADLTAGSAMSSPKAVCSERTASSVYFWCTTQETLISEVEIICRLTPSFASTLNIFAATPE